MKTAILLVGLSIFSTVAFAAADPNGQGMYCSPTAEDAAQSIAKINGASDKEIEQAVTASVDPVQGTDYTTRIGKDTYVVSTDGNDGTCLVKSVTRK